MHRKTIGLILKSPWFWVILAGYLLRIALMPVTGQYDVLFMPWMTHYINLGHFNLYAYLFEKFGSIVMQRPGVWASYPYGFYFLTAGWLQFLAKLHLVDLVNWQSAWQVANPARLVFLSKAAYLPFDLGIGYILFRTCGRLGLALWAWSPLALYTPFMMGQNDIFATAFAVAGTFAASKALRITHPSQSGPARWHDKWAFLASVALGIGSIFKIYPILLLPPLVLLLEKRWGQRLVLLLIGCSFLAAASIPFITTPAYLNGVLFNAEGTNILREIQFFGIAVSPFLTGYLILLGYLIVAGPAAPGAHLAWFTSLFVLAFLFLWIPVPLYWLIWITPFLISVLGQSPRAWVAWAALQLAFTGLLLDQHRELGVALPIHLAGIFNLPNLTTALAVTHPSLYRAFTDLLPVSRGLLVAALLVALWLASKALLQKLQPAGQADQLQWWLFVPTAVLLLGLAVNLYFSRNLVSRNNSFVWQDQTLSTGVTLSQKLDLENREVTGVKFRFTQASPSAAVKLCLYRTGYNIDQIPLMCVTRNTTDQVENQVLYFVFSRKIHFEASDTPTITIQVIGAGASLELPYTIAINQSLQIDQTQLNGSLDISSLSPLNITQAFKTLVISNIFRDAWFLGSIVLATVLVVVFIAILVHRFQALPHFGPLPSGEGTPFPLRGKGGG